MIVVPSLFFVTCIPLTEQLVGSDTVASYFPEFWQKTVWPYATWTFEATRRYHITSVYGLHKEMAGVNGRNELVISGGMSVNKERERWIEYDFKFKPTDIKDS